jgi:predicted nuclease of predicted toxin-antitoxin system
VNLDSATDREVWEYAGEHSYVLASKDSDFRQLAFLHGPPPKVLWLRVGNVSTATVHQVLVDHRAAIEAFVAHQEEALLVVPGLADGDP